MKAAAFYSHDGVVAVRVVDNYPVPVPEQGQLLIKVLSAGLNPRDVKLVSYKIPEFIVPLPKVVGTDICGIVISTDKCKNSKFKTGDRIYALLDLLHNHDGGVAEYVAVKQELLALAPTNLTANECASIPLVALTVVQALAPYLKSVNYESANKRVLIQAGAGGVGSFAVQYCKHILQMHVFATCSAMHIPMVKALGADIVIDYHHDDFTQIALGCDVVLDCKSYIYEERTLNSNVLKTDVSIRIFYLPTAHVD